MHFDIIFLGGLQYQCNQRGQNKTFWHILLRQLYYALYILRQYSVEQLIDIIFNLNAYNLFLYIAVSQLRIHQRLFNVEISFASNSFIIKD